MIVLNTAINNVTGTETSGLKQKLLFLQFTNLYSYEEFLGEKKLTFPMICHQIDYKSTVLIISAPGGCILASLWQKLS